MTGPGHYHEAELALAAANKMYYQGDLDDLNWQLRFAQVHATMALAAATALGEGSNARLNDPIVASWWEVAS